MHNDKRNGRNKNETNITKRSSEDDKKETDERRKLEKKK